MFIKYLILFSISLSTNSLAIPKQENLKRVYDNVLSDEVHYNENDDHNADYDHEAFLGEDGAQSFNDLTPEESKIRLGKIVDKIDADKNGFVTLEELKYWIQYTQKRYIFEDVNRQWKGLNPDDHPSLSWNEYKGMTYGFADSVDDETSHYKDMIERDHRRWKKADQDKDGDMTKNEFSDFIHPEEAEHMKDLVVMETIEDIDTNKDGKISLEEYIGDMYSENDVKEQPQWVSNERDQFTQYRDKNKDGYMDFDEVKKWILPEDYDNSEAEAKHLVYESDVNRDGQLNKDEILDKHDLFVGSQATDFGEALTRHDEF